MIDLDKIKNIVAEFTDGSDMFLVDVKSTPGNVIEVTIDSDTTVSIDRCVELSRKIDDAFDREQEDFELTVASAGIGQPITLYRQYLKTVGENVDVTLKSGEKFSAKLTNATENSITVEYQEKQIVEGKKRKQLVDIVREFALEDVKSVVLQISFK